MKIAFAGTPEPAVIALERLLTSDHEIAGVITRPDARRGRGRSLHPSPVAELAQRHGLPVFKPTSLKKESQEATEIATWLQEEEIRCIPVVAYGALLQQHMIDIPPLGWLNLHYSLLPQWRGAAPVQAALRAGQNETGATVFRIDTGLDTGDILGQVRTPITPGTTADALLGTLAQQGADLLVDVLDALEQGTAQTQPQRGEATYAPKLTSADGHIDWTQPAQNIAQQICAVTPNPGAWTMLGEKRVKITQPVVVLSDHEPIEPGTLQVHKHAVYVGTGTEPVQLQELQMPGKRSMAAADWGRGVGSQQELRFV